jgi:hypothetical protein
VRLMACPDVIPRAVEIPSLNAKPQASAQAPSPTACR